MLLDAFLDNHSESPECLARDMARIYRCLHQSFDADKLDISCKLSHKSSFKKRKLCYNVCVIFRKEVLTMENLVVSIFNTESEAYQSFADLKAFRQTQTTKVAQIALVKN